MKTAIEKLASKISKLGLDLDKTIELVRLMHEALDDEKTQIEDAHFDAMQNPSMWVASKYYESKYNK